VRSRCTVALVLAPREGRHHARGQKAERRREAVRPAPFELDKRVHEVIEVVFERRSADGMYNDPPLSWVAIDRRTGEILGYEVIARRAQLDAAAGDGWKLDGPDKDGAYLLKPVSPAA
jgi:hypothetical protein